MSSRRIHVCWTSWRPFWAPEIILSNVTHIVKEPNNRAFISWHRDLACLGFDGCDQVSAWLALSIATAHSGCIQIILRSHREGMRDQQTAHDPDNVLSQLRTITNVDDSPAVGCELEPGEVSLHHGWSVHCSRSNLSDGHRSRLNAQYVRPGIRQTKSDRDSAMPV